MSLCVYCISIKRRKITPNTAIDKAANLPKKEQQNNPQQGVDQRPSLHHGQWVSSLVL